MNEMILRTPEQTTPEWFAIERAYTAEAQVDVSIVLNNHRDTDNSTKAREIALVVASGYGKRYVIWSICFIFVSKNIN